MDTGDVDEPICEQCHHPSGPHYMIAPGDPLQGGIMVCPSQDCACFATWDVRQAEPPEPFCGFCMSEEHRPYRCPSIRSQVDYELWALATRPPVGR